MPRRQNLAVTLILAVVLFFSISYFFSATPHIPNNLHNLQKEAPRPAQAASKEATRDATSESDFNIDLDELPSLEGDSIAPKLENATLKAELGRATWRFLHTMVSRFPDKPSPEERKTLESFLHLFSRLYPCGDCARHFRELLAKHPPQTGSRNTAAGWLCAMHNKVNERLEKPMFDCNNIGDFYDCGCGDEKKDGKDTNDTKDTKGGKPKVEETLK